MESSSQVAEVVVGTEGVKYFSQDFDYYEHRAEQRELIQKLLLMQEEEVKMEDSDESGGEALKEEVKGGAEIKVKKMTPGELKGGAIIKVKKMAPGELKGGAIIKVKKMTPGDL